MLRHCRYQLRPNYPEQGFTLVTVLAIGMIMMLLGTGLIVRSQKDSAIAASRRDTSKTLAIVEGALGRTLVLLKQPNNSVLLTRNYDPINPRTGKNYLGADGDLNSGDEGNIGIDEWTGYNPSTSSCYQQAAIGVPDIPITGTLGEGSYTGLAYCYNSIQHVGTVIVEGSYAGQSKTITVSFTVRPILDNFPGVLIHNAYTGGAAGEGKLILRSRTVLGQGGNVYYPPISSNNPSLTGISKLGDANRGNYLSAIFSVAPTSPDPVGGNIYACKLTLSWPITPQGINLGNITSSLTLSGTPGSVTHYQVNTINLANADTIIADTTAGPIYLYIRGNGVVDANMVNLRGTSKILNIRTDGRPPRVGNFRIITNNNSHIALYDQSCIQDAFVYFPMDAISFLTTAGGCQSANNNNFVGVAWVEAIKNAKNSTLDPDVSYPDGNLLFNTTITPNVTAGITVPNDISSLTDLLQYIDLPVRYQFGKIKNWRREKL